MTLVSRARLKSITELDDAVQLLRDLGYDRPPRSVEVETLDLKGLATAIVLRTAGPRRSGYGVLVGETLDPPRSLRPLARTIQREIHDRPLAVLGVPDASTGWSRMIVFRPRRAGGELGAVTISRLEVDLRNPSGHDVEVLSELQWRPSPGNDDKAQDHVDRALDVEAVTRRFYRSLVPHFRALEAAVSGAAARNVITAAAIDEAGGTRRVTIRILTQILFCYFLQRKRLIAGDRDYLSRAYSQRSGPYYASVLEPLFYDILSKPAHERSAGLGGLEIPFLNGGLFERRYGEASLDLPDEVFALEGGLIGYLDHWTFTVGEERADEQEVAVDPEMLGRIFESLLPEKEREQKGTYYTPRPVVQFMCREALVARLGADPTIGETVMRRLVTDDTPLEGLADDCEPKTVRGLLRAVDQHLDVLTVLDPAVGSGAFLLGTLGEIIRLRSIAHLAIHGRHAGADQVYAWKLHAIERTLFGVDIEPVAVELCRLRLWLSLVVELESTRPVPPLPNLEYRTLCANSLVDFVESAPLQNTRGSHDLIFDGRTTGELVELRARYFEAADPEEKRRLRGDLLGAESSLLATWLAGLNKQQATRPLAQERLRHLEAELLSPDRAYPVFMPEFSAPDVWQAQGWDIVIMNPPYVSRKELRQRYPEGDLRAIEAHFGATNDTMILFADRARQLARPDGVVSMIFNDSIFTSADGNAFRRDIFRTATITSIARTKCFEGQAINGGVVVARLGATQERGVRWVEGYGQPVEDFAGASGPQATLGPGGSVMAGALELFEGPREAYVALPHRPLFRPSQAALEMLEPFTRAMPKAIIGNDPIAAWDNLSNTRALEKRVSALDRTGFYSRLKPGGFVLLGLVTEGGQGLATADDRRFLGAIDGTEAADDHRRTQEALERAARKSRFSSEYESLLRTKGARESALLALWEAHGADRGNPLPWPRIGTFQVVGPERVRRTLLTEAERQDGIASRDCWVPFEKGDQSQEVESTDGRASKIGSAWARDNPIVIDWSVDAVQLLRRRAASKGAQRPRIQSEDLWFHEGVTWNSVTSYLRARRVPGLSIFGHKAPLLRPLAVAPWLSLEALLALLNSSTADFIVRTFLGSRMQVEVGDLRRLPIPVLDEEHRALLEELAGQAIDARRPLDNGESRGLLKSVEARVDDVVSSIYGLRPGSDLWVVR